MENSFTFEVKFNCYVDIRQIIKKMFYNVEIDSKLTINTYQHDTSKESCQAFLHLHLPNKTTSRLVFQLMHLLPIEPYGMLLRFLRRKNCFAMRKPSNKDFKVDRFSIPDPQTQ